MGHYGYLAVESDTLDREEIQTFYHDWLRDNIFRGDDSCRKVSFLNNHYDKQAPVGVFKGWWEDALVELSQAHYDTIFTVTWIPTESFYQHDDERPAERWYFQGGKGYCEIMKAPVFDPSKLDELW